MVKKFFGWVGNLNTLGQCTVTLAALIPVTVGAVAAFRQHCGGPNSAAKVAFETGRHQFDARDYSEAEISFERALAASPDFDDARFYQARALANVGRDGEAFDKVQTMEKEEPSVARNYVLGGYIRYMMRDYQPAEAQLNQALSLAPENTDALFTRAQSRAWQHKYASAASDLERIDAISPTDAKARFMLARVYARLGRSAEADATCNKLYHLDTSNPTYSQLCGVIAHSAGEYDRAVYFYELAARREPGLPDLKANIELARAHQPPVGSKASTSDTVVDRGQSETVTKASGAGI